MNTERKYRKSVYRNSWQRKLQIFTFNTAPEFSGYCPYFWFTWLCIFLLPITLLGKVIEFFAGLIISFFSRNEVEKEEEIPIDYEGVQPAPRDLVRIYENIQKLKSQNEDIEAFIKDRYQAVCYFGCSFSEHLWIVNNLDKIELYYELALAAVKKMDEKLQIKQARAAARQRYLNTILAYSSWTIKPFIVIAAIIVAYFIYKIVLAATSVITLKSVAYTGGILAIVVAVSYALSLLGVVFVSIKRQIQKINRNIQPEIPKIEKPTVFSRIIRGIEEGCVFCIETVAALYKRECPMVVWVDSPDQETPIEKNQQ